MVKSRDTKTTVKKKSRLNLNLPTKSIGFVSSIPCAITPQNLINGPINVGTTLQGPRVVGYSKTQQFVKELTNSRQIGINA